MAMPTLHRRLLRSALLASLCCLGSTDSFAQRTTETFTLVDTGPHQFAIVVQNACDWPQVIRVRDLGTDLDAKSITIPSREATVLRYSEDVVPYEDYSGWSIDIEIVHDEARQGDKVCLNLQRTVSLTLRWEKQPDANAAIRSGPPRAFEPVMIALTQREGVPPTGTGVGGDYPTVPVGGVTTMAGSNTVVTTYPLTDTGAHQLAIEVQNQCDWPQGITVTDLGADAPPKSVTIPALGGTLLPFGETVVPYEDYSGWSIDIEITHDEARQGNKVCLELARTVTLKLRWEKQPDKDAEIRSGPPRVFEPVTVTLTQREGTGSTSEPPPPTTGNTGGDDGGCGLSNDCLPLDSCASGVCGGAPPWTPTLPDGWDSTFQVIGAETTRVRIEITLRQASAPSRRDQNVLGLLSRSVSEFVEWWMPVLHAAEDATQGGLQKGLQFLISSQGGSTGKNLTMQVLNFTGKPVSLQGMLALEPLKKDAQQRTTQAFAKLVGRQLPTKVDLNAYCLDFLKLPPIAGQVLTVAGPEVQKRFAPLKRIMGAANQLAQHGQLKPDSNPASYADSVKQWAIWSVEQKFNEKRFGEAFMGHTKKNVEAAGQKWAKQFEDIIRQRTPNRWQDIVQVLKGAGAAVPQ